MMIIFPDNELTLFCYDGNKYIIKVKYKGLGSWQIMYTFPMTCTIPPVQDCEVYEYICFS